MSSFSKLNLDIIQVVKIQKLQNQLILNDSKLRDFSQFLANKSLGSEQYLSVNILYKTNLYKDKILEFFSKEDGEQPQVDVEAKDKNTTQQPMMEQIRGLVLQLKKYKVLDQLINSISQENKQPILDAQSFYSIITKSLSPYTSDLKDLDLETTTVGLINLLKLT